MSGIIFLDSETRSPLDIRATGAYRYTHHPKTDVTIWAYASSEDFGSLWSPEWAWHKNPDKYPEALLEHALAGGYLVAWNAFFDRHVWNEVMVKKYGWPATKREQWLCAQVQAEGNNLPGGLAKAAECANVKHQKDPVGKRLMDLLANGTREDWNPEHFEAPENMGRFRGYCLYDVLSMRDIWHATRPLTLDEWADYHASEMINDRGVKVDKDFATCAMNYANAEFADLNKEIAEVSGDRRMTVTAHVRKARWLYDELHPCEELQELVTRPPKKKGDPERYSCDRSTREIVLERLSVPDIAKLFHVKHLGDIIDFLEIIEAGNSAAVRKFTAMSNQAYHDRVYGQYSCNGAGQTGRFSSRGIQIHNLIRAPLEKGNPNRAIDAIEDIMNGMLPEDLVDKYNLPLSRLLARLIRPSFIADEGNVLVWADWDQIEGRTLPWLSKSPGGDKKLRLYESGIDVYKVAAAILFNMKYEDIKDESEQRQVGKVSELALGFGGAAGAFKAMGKNYGVVLPTDQIQTIVYAWRNNNSWCPDFWAQLWDTVLAAYRSPGTWFSAGRVSYLFHPNLMRGTLICKLPCGRWLTYPQFKRERIEYVDDDGRTKTRMRTSFVKGFGSGYARVDLWYGTLAENITQGTAASALRYALRQVAEDVVLHTHDEIVCECSIDAEAQVKKRLRQAMTKLPEWADGLPLSVSFDSGPFYTK